ncbi:MAG: DUF2905 domain-containing protein [Candidatus Omnitrophica bacterium]|jgi:hypothetical protein|nr:DUF2905 domain-containing protein [Candidatus Omnitrophota bacterium]
MKEMARLLIVSGVILVLAGLVMAGLGKVPGVGKLPGDFYYKRGNFSFYFPLATCLLVSLLGTLIFNFFKKGNP